MTDEDAYAFMEAVTQALRESERRVMAHVDICEQREAMPAWRPADDVPLALLDSWRAALAERGRDAY